MNYLQRELYDLIKTDSSVFDFLQESALDGLWYWDLENPDEEWMNEAFWQTLGYDPKEMPHKASAWQEIIFPEDREAAVRAAHHHIANPQQKYDQITRYRHKDSSTVWIRCRGMAIRDEQGQPKRMLGAHIDVTHAFALEQKHREKAETYETFIENQSVYLIKIDLQGNYTFVNSHYCHDFNWKKEELLGQSSAKGIVEEDIEKCIRVAEKCAQNPGQKFKETLTKRLNDGSIKVGEWEFVCVTDSNGKPYEIICFGYDITERVKSSRKEKDALQKFVFISSNTSDGIVIIDQGKTTYTSDSFQALFGYSLSELQGFSKQERIKLIHPDDREAVLATIEQHTLKKAGAFHYQYRFRHKEGHYLHREDRISVEYTADGQPLRSLIIARNIDSEKKRDMALQKSKAILAEKNRELDLVLKQAGMGVWKLFFEDNSVYLDKYLSQLYEYPAGEQRSLLKDWLNCIHASDRTLITQAIASIKSGEDHFTAEYRASLKSGKNSFHLMHGTTLTDRKGENIIGIIGTIVDISQRKKREEEIVLTKETLEHMSKMAQVGGWEVDLEDGYNVWSRTTYDIFGEPYSYRPNPEKDILRYKEGYSRDKIIEAFANLSETGDTFDEHLQIITTSGEERWVRVQGRPFKKYGKVTKVFGTIQDIHENYLQQAALKRAKDQAEMANVAKSDFLANMSHEIRTPLNSVIGFSDLMLRSNLGYQQQQYMHSINSSAVSLLSLINDILDFSKIEAGQLDIVEEAVEVQELASQISDVMRHSATQKGLEFLVEIDEHIPDYLHLDLVRIRQILLNLIGNAIKFTSEGYIKVSIKKHSEATENGKASYTFSVQDSGIGIAEKQQEKIFEAFKQEDSTTSRNYGGTGLGLSISSRLVELMGSQLDLQSQVGKGSTFSFTLKLKGEKAEQSASRSIKDIQGVLLIIQQEARLNAAEALLQQHSIPYQTSRNATEGLHMLSKDPHGFDLIIIDQELPLFNGIEVSYKIRTEASTLAVKAGIILIHPQPEQVKAKELEKGGIISVIAADFQPQELISNITRILSQRPQVADTPLGESSSIDFDRSQLNILVVDDNTVNIILATNMLKKVLGEEIALHTAQNGQEAIDKAKEFTPQLILMDVQMPIMNGLEATEEIRKLSLQPEPVILALTAGATQGSKEKALASGMNGFLTKPIALQVMEKALQKWLPKLQLRSKAKPKPVERTKMEASALKIFNKSLALERIGGDEKALADVLDIVKGGMFTEMSRKISYLLDHGGTGQQVSSLAHAMKGASMGVGFEQLASLCKELELLTPFSVDTAREKLSSINQEISNILNLIANDKPGDEPMNL